MKILLPTERAMGLVTVLSGLAIPVAILIGAGEELAADGIAVQIFDVVMWIVNPFGMWAYHSLGGLAVGANAVLGYMGTGRQMWVIIGTYVGGTAMSALFWGLIDGYFRARRKANANADAD